MRNRVRALFIWLAQTLVAVLFLLPLIMAFVVSLRRSGTAPSAQIEWLPQVFHWETYAEVFRTVPMARYLINSLFVVALAVPITLLTASLAGFAMSQLAKAQRKALINISLALLLVPGAAVWTFRFHILNWLGLVDSLWALIVPAFAGGSSLFVLLFFWAYWRIPRELYESARLDGASAWQVWWLVGVPLSVPTLVAAGVLAFAQYWGDYASSMLYLYSPKNYTLPIGLQLLRQMDDTNLPLLMAGAVMMTLPVIILIILIPTFTTRRGILPETIEGN